METEHRSESRHLITVARELSLGIVSFRERTWTSHTALLKNMSRAGAGIECRDLLEPGFIWFCEPLFGRRSALLVWSRQRAGLTEAGMRFFPLSHEEEHFLKQQVVTVRQHLLLRDTETFIEIVLESVGRRAAGH